MHLQGISSTVFFYKSKTIHDFQIAEQSNPEPVFQPRNNSSSSRIIISTATCAVPAGTRLPLLALTFSLSAFTSTRDPRICLCRYVYLSDPFQSPGLPVNFDVRDWHRAIQMVPEAPEPAAALIDPCTLLVEMCFL